MARKQTTKTQKAEDAGTAKLTEPKSAEQIEFEKRINVLKNKTALLKIENEYLKEATDNIRLTKIINKKPWYKRLFKRK